MISPRRPRIDPEDRRYLALLWAAATVVLGAAGWALGQDLPEPPTLLIIPERVLRLIWAPENPPAALPPPGVARSAPSGARASPTIVRSRVRAWAHEPASDETFDVSTWRFEPVEPVLTPLDPRLGGESGAPLRDVGVGPLALAPAREVTIAPLEARMVPRVRAAPAPATVAEPRLEDRLVRALLRRHAPDLRRCVEHAQARFPAAQGRLVLRLRSTGDGRVSVTVAGDGLAQGPLEACLQSLSRRWSLPPGATGEAKHPLVLVGR